MIQIETSVSLCSEIMVGSSVSKARPTSAPTIRQLWQNALSSAEGRLIQICTLAINLMSLNTI